MNETPKLKGGANQQRRP